MTFDEKLKMVEVLTEEHDEDVLSTYLKLSESKMLHHLYPFGTGDEELPHEHDVLHCEIAQHLILKRGAEGETRHSENGVDRSYGNAEIPPSMLRRLIPKAGVL